MSAEFNRDRELSKHPIRICVVGHTNHGKTSTIRTLIDGTRLGTVSQGPDSTIRVETFRVSKDGFDRFYVYDTPGFSNLDLRLAEAEERLGRLPVPEELVDSLRSKPADHDRWLVDTLRTVVNSHLVIFVLDSRKDPASKTYLAELEFLKGCGVPLVVSLNFVHRKESNVEAWKKNIRKMGIGSIVEFDAHLRTWRDEQDLFKCMRPLLGDPKHYRLHREFMDYWSEFREEAAREARLGAAEDIYLLLEQVSGFKVVIDEVDEGNLREKEIEAENAFKAGINALIDEAFSRILERFGFSMDMAKKDAFELGGGRSVLTMNFFDHSWLKWSAAATAAGTTLLVESAFGFLTFGIPTALAAGAAYCAASAWQTGTEDSGTSISHKPTEQLFLLIASAALSLAKELKSRGRADPNLVGIQMNMDVIGNSSELREQLMAMFQEGAVDERALKACLYEKISEQ